MEINKVGDVLIENNRIFTIMKKIPIYDPNIDKSKLYEIRRDILKLIESTIRYYVRNDRFCLWEKSCLYQAIRCCAVNAYQNNTKIMLEASLSRIVLSAVDPDNRNEKGIEPQINDLNEDVLLKVVNELLQHVKTNA